MCEFFGVFRSRYYSFLKRGTQSNRESVLLGQIQECRGSGRYMDTYGCCRIQIWLSTKHEPKGQIHMRFFGYNAIMESFYRTLKRELVQDAHYDNPEQSRMDIFKYIELYYNSKRMHSALDWLSPTQFEARAV